METILVDALGIVLHSFLLRLPQGLFHRDPDALKNILVLRECFGALVKQQRGFPNGFFNLALGFVWDLLSQDPVLVPEAVKFNLFGTTPSQLP